MTVSSQNHLVPPAAQTGCRAGNKVKPCIITVIHGLTCPDAGILAGRGQMAQITQYAANRSTAGSRSVKYPASQGVGNEPVWACVLPSDPHAEAFATPRATARSARQAGAGSVQQQRDDRAGEAAATAPFIVDVRPAPVAMVKPEAKGVSMRVDTLTDSDVSNLKAIFEHEIAGSTLNNYLVQWRHFLAWALEKDVQALPADPAQVAAYLAERIQEHGHKPATLRVAASAIAFAHKTVQADDPCASPEVKKTLRCATRKAGKDQKQAEALTEEALSAIEATACEPRLGRGGRYESQETARSRGHLDIALISLMRDAMLRVSEAAVLSWRDIESEADGTGRLLIRRSKTDVEGQGAVAFLSAQTMAALALIRDEAAQDDSVFGLRPNQISARIKQAAQAADLGDGYSGHSPRVGMARDLARAGTELPSLMNAGRWRSPAMPAHYTRNESAGKGAVAQFHGCKGRPGQ